MDDGFAALTDPSDATPFIGTCRKLRFWPREVKVHAV
jgi:catalase